MRKKRKSEAAEMPKKKNKEDDLDKKRRKMPIEERRPQIGKFIHVVRLTFVCGIGKKEEMKNRITCQSGGGFARFGFGYGGRLFRVQEMGRGFGGRGSQVNLKTII